MRGGGPHSPTMRRSLNWSSPHARGWSQARVLAVQARHVFPACAGVVPRRVKPASNPPGSSPHARGWSRHNRGHLVRHLVFPACAGVVRGFGFTVFGIVSLPRMRGGGPKLDKPEPVLTPSSPHARGWSGRSGPSGPGKPVFPACAGVVPRSPLTARFKVSLPRMRGGGPAVRIRRAGAG